MGTGCFDAVSPASKSISYSLNVSYVQKHCNMLVTFEFNFSFHLFVKHYTNTQILVEMLLTNISCIIEIDLKFNLRVFKFKTFPGGWGACPQTP